MRALLLASLLGMSSAHADEAELQQAFVLGMQAQQAGDLGRAESIFRNMLEDTQSPRVKLELARTLFAQAKYAEAKAMFKEVSVQPETPWRVRDNIALFVREIEERTGYLKFGVTVVSDSNPGNLARQKEFSIGDLQVTPVDAPKRLTGLRYSAQGWKPFEPIGGAGYLTASYVDYPTEEFDRLTVDAGFARNLVASGRLRGKAGLEFGTADGHSL
ncbi:MAG TPA: tetratricopeptide repeat protein, partial [Burkholderiales bacterium]|nr:tetratricopeptide repeat protein [Burkholderiales bacterium]